MGAGLVSDVTSGRRSVEGVLHHEHDHGSNLTGTDRCETDIRPSVRAFIVLDVEFADQPLNSLIRELNVCREFIAELRSVRGTSFGPHVVVDRSFELVGLGVLLGRWTKEALFGHYSHDVTLPASIVQALVVSSGPDQEPES
jgi:hypothetical protein